MCGRLWSEMGLQMAARILLRCMLQQAPFQAATGVWMV